MPFYMGFSALEGSGLVEGSIGPVECGNESGGVLGRG